jgi:putative methionine-R-sulfoxide reductase with GAF domain
MKASQSEDRSETPAEKDFAIRERNALYRRTWRNWFLLAGVLIITTIGLATSIPPLLTEEIVRFWPWVKTDFVLVVGLSLTVLAFVGYLTQQQRDVLRMHKKLQQFKEDYQGRMQQHTARLYALSSISRIMSTENHLQSIFQSITRVCAETFACHRASLMLVDEENNELVVRSVCGQYDTKMLDMRQKVGEGIAGWAAAHGESILLSNPGDSRNYPDLTFNDPSLVSTMVVPIFVREGLVGVINITSQSSQITYDGEDLHALQIFAENAGVCIKHAEHVHWLKQMIPRHVDGPKKKKRASYVVDK